MKSNTMGQTPSIVWFKRDLRVNDHAPLFKAATSYRRVCEPVVSLRDKDAALVLEMIVHLRAATPSVKP